MTLQAKDLPFTYSIKKRILNTRWNVLPTPGTADRVQMKLKDSLIEQTQRLIKDKKLENCNTLNVKVSGDGTRIGKRLQLLNVTYTIINEGNVAMSEKGNYVIAVIKTKIDYIGIRDSLSDLRDEMRNLSRITYGNELSKLSTFLVRTGNFLQLYAVLGQLTKTLIVFSVSATFLKI